jgi:hypothetical protein
LSVRDDPAWSAGSCLACGVLSIAIVPNPPSSLAQWCNGHCHGWDTRPWGSLHDARGPAHPSDKAAPGAMEPPILAPSKAGRNRGHAPRSAAHATSRNGVAPVGTRPPIEIPGHPAGRAGHTMGVRAKGFARGAPCGHKPARRHRVAQATTRPWGSAPPPGGRWRVRRSRSPRATEGGRTA